MRRTLALALTLTIASHAGSAEPPMDITNSTSQRRQEGAADVPLPKRTPATRRQIEREEG